MRVRVLGLAPVISVVVTLGLVGCQINDSTENELPMTFRNSLTVPVTVRYCDNAACTSSSWTDTIAPGHSSSDSIAADGSVTTFGISSADGRGCVTLRLTRQRAEKGLTVRAGMLKSCASKR